MQALSSFPPAEGAHAPSDRVEAQMSAPDERQEGHRVLVVDDAPDVADLFAVILRRAGFDATQAHSGPGALSAAKATAFDLIVSDIGMPGMDGYELARAVRATPGYADVPLVAVTGFAEYSDRERAFAAGFDAHLTKPVDPRQLVALVGQLCG